METIYKKHPIVILSTKNGDNAIISNNGKLGNYRKDYLYTQEYLNSTNSSSHHLYILSEDKIKEGDWVLSLLTNNIIRVEKDNINNLSTHKIYFKKIIATTNSLLTISKDSIGKSFISSIDNQNKLLPQIPESFIKYFIEQYNKGNIITDVNVEYIEPRGCFEGDYYQGNGKFNLKVTSNNTITIKPIKERWSREEVIELIKKFDIEERCGNGIFDIDKWIEQNL
jgi:hypothetical protein